MTQDDLLILFMSLSSGCSCRFHVASEFDAAWSVVGSWTHEQIQQTLLWVKSFVDVCWVVFKDTLLVRWKKIGQVRKSLEAVTKAAKSGCFCCVFWPLLSISTILTVLTVVICCNIYRIYIESIQRIHSSFMKDESNHRKWEKGLLTVIDWLGI